MNSEKIPRIKIMTDSASDIPNGRAEELNIDIIPIPITVDGIGYLEGQDFSPREFYAIMENANQIPTTSQISPITYCEHYHQAFEEGYTDVILISFTSTASGTYHRAVSAREMFFQNCPEASENGFQITVLDSKMFSLAYGYPVMEAARMIQEGETSTQKIIDFLQYWFDHVEAYFTAFTFEYIKKSGRISCAASIVGEALGIRPIIQIKKGQMKIFAKPRGNQAVLKKLTEILKDRILPDSPYIMLNGTFPHAAEDLTKLIQDTTGRTPIGPFDVGASVAINSGPQMIGIGFLVNE